MADSYETNVIQGMVSMLAKSSTFQTLVGEATEANARKHIIEGWGGSAAFDEVAEGKAIASDGSSEITLTDAHAHVFPIDYTIDTSQSRNFEARAGTARIVLVVPDSGANPKAKFEFMMNTVGNIRQECFNTTLSESTGVPALADITLSGFERQEIEGAYTGSTLAYIDINWRAP